MSWTLAISISNTINFLEPQIIFDTYYVSAFYSYNN